MVSYSILAFVSTTVKCFHFGIVYVVLNVHANLLFTVSINGKTEDIAHLQKNNSILLSQEV